MKTQKIVLLLLFALVFFSSKAQNLYLRTITGTQTAYSIANIKNLIFSGGNLLVNNTTGSNGTFALSSLRYFNFTDLTLGISTIELVKSKFYVAGGKMKEAGTTHWLSSNTGADNSSGFTALPSGQRYNDGQFQFIGARSIFWTSNRTSPSGFPTSYVFSITNDYENLQWL
ncbi:FISUMP domain-containing protein [Flavobacterium sp.]|uniref:FISUMP domain-containing protein n=1 Tax=Flavobacterium sp. TaxID=239 RepID=UPI0025DFD8E4|nr:FISUMP domain-containing protein [Flavobacterium sp.]